MDPAIASRIAQRAHLDQSDRFGGRVIDHVARVASAMPANASSVAWLHDILERTDTTVETLRGDGLTRLEEAALDLLTRRDGESYEVYALRVTFASGDAGRIARIVKRADLDDHISTALPATATPPYGWARQHIANAQWRNHEPAVFAVVSSPDHETLRVASGL